VTLLSCLGMNILGSDQYMAIVLPGRMYRTAFEQRGLAPKNLSRALEDSATLTSPLIPWNTCGAFMIATLGLKPWSYVPYCFLNLLNPLISAFYGYTGITMEPAVVVPPTDQSVEALAHWPTEDVEDMPSAPAMRLRDSEG